MASTQQPPMYVPPPNVYPEQVTHPVTTPTAAIDKVSGERFKVAFFAALGFAFLSHPGIYHIVNQIFIAFTREQNEIITEWGTPTTKGIFLHSIVFFLFMLFVMYR